MEKSKIVTLGPELTRWGYEIIFEQLLSAMDPTNYRVKKRDSRRYVIEEKYAKLDENKEATGEYEWRRRYSHDHDSKKAGYFTSHDKAIQAIEKIIEVAARDFDKVKEEIENLPDYEED